jgi:hypothetical protein
MAKRTATRTTIDNASVNRSEKIREYHAANPNAKHSEIATALAGEGYEIKTSLVSSVLGKRASANKLTTAELVKLASTFVKAHKGKVADATAAIESVGQFIDACGSSEKAKEALTTFQAVSEAIK